MQRIDYRRLTFRHCSKRDSDSAAGDGEGGDGDDDAGAECAAQCAMAGEQGGAGGIDVVHEQDVAQGAMGSSGRRRQGTAHRETVPGGWSRSAAFRKMVPGGRRRRTAFRKMVPGGRRRRTAFRKMVPGGWSRRAAFREIFPGGWGRSATFGERGPGGRGGQREGAGEKVESAGADGEGRGDVGGSGVGVQARLAAGAAGTDEQPAAGRNREFGRDAPGDDLRLVVAAGTSARPMEGDRHHQVHRRGAVPEMGRF